MVSITWFTRIRRYSVPAAQSPARLHYFYFRGIIYDILQSNKNNFDFIYMFKISMHAYRIGLNYSVDILLWIHYLIQHFFRHIFILSTFLACLLHPLSAKRQNSTQFELAQPTCIGISLGVVDSISRDGGRYLPGRLYGLEYRCSWKIKHLCEHFFFTLLVHE